MLLFGCQPSSHMAFEQEPKENLLTSLSTADLDIDRL
jgi:hypothetical protein